jgi:hypothetical protein
VLERALAGEEVSKTALDSARSLFSYRSDAPPTPEPTVSQGGAKVVSLGSLLGAAFESNGVLELHGELRSGDRVWTRL